MKTTKTIWATVCLLSMMLTASCSTAPYGVGDEDDYDDDYDPSHIQSSVIPSTSNSELETPQEDPSLEDTRPNIDIISKICNENIEIEGADGYGSLEIDVDGRSNDVFYSENGVSFTHHVNDDNVLNVYINDTWVSSITVIASQTMNLTAGDRVTISPIVISGKSIDELDFQMKPVEYVVPELGTYITQTSQITNEIVSKLLDIQTWDSHNNNKDFFEGYLVHSAYIGEVQPNIDWDGNTKVGLWLVAVNGHYWPSYFVISLTDIQVYGDGEVKADASFYDLYDDERELEIVKKEWVFEEIQPTPQPNISADTRPQIELFENIYNSITFWGNEGSGMIAPLDFGEEGDVIHIEGDLYFVISNSTYDHIQVIKDNACIAEFCWGFSKSTGLNSEDVITVGLWFLSESPIQSFDELPFQFIPTQIVVPELGKIIANKELLPTDIKSAIEPHSSWNPIVSSSGLAVPLQIPQNATITDIYLSELKPEKILDEKYTSSFGLLVKFRADDGYYAVWLYDLMSYSDGSIKPKYTSVFFSDEYSELDEEIQEKLENYTITILS